MARQWYRFFYVHLALTEIYDDDIEDGSNLNGARQSTIVESEHTEYVYLLNGDKPHSTEQIASLEYFDPIEITEEEDVDSSNAIDQREISQQPQDEWHLIEGENDEDLNSLVDSQHETEPVPNKRRRHDSTDRFSEQVLSSTMRQPNEATTMTSPANTNQTESVTKNVAQANAEEVIELPRITASAIESHDEATLFALSLVGTLKRLPPRKLLTAKCHILTYLTQLEYGDMDAKLSWSFWESILGINKLYLHLYLYRHKFEKGIKLLKKNIMKSFFGSPIYHHRRA